MEMDITPEKRESLSKEISPIVDRATSIVVKTPDQSLEAQDVLKEIKSRQKRISDFFKPMKEAAHQAWKRVCDTENSFLEPLKQAESVIKSKVSAYLVEEDRKRQAEEQKAEAARLEAERKERERLEEQAKKAEADGKPEKADALRERAENVAVTPKFVPPPPQVKADGTQVRKTWVGECTDIVALCRAIGNGSAMPNLVTVNQSAVNALAKVVKNTMQVPGLKFNERADIAVRV